jgi:predicted PurR-regulated permease PerM
LEWIGLDTKIARGILVGGVLLFLAILLIQTILRLFDVMVVLFLGLMLAQAIEPFIAAMERRRVPRAAGVLAIYLAVLALAVTIGWLVLPPVAQDFGIFLTRLPQLADQAMTSLTPITDVLSRFGLTVEARSGLSQLLQQLGGNLLGVLTVPLAAFNIVVSAFTIFVFAFLFSVSGARLQLLLVSLVYPDKREPAMVVGQHVGARLGGYVRSELLVMTSVGLLCWVGLLIVGAPFPHLFALVAFFTEAIPMVGPILGAIPPLLVSLFISPWLTLQVGVVYLVVQEIENYVLAPMIHGSQLAISPLLVITALLVGSGIYGIVGAFIAVPVAAALQVLFEDIILPWREAQIAAHVAQNTSPPPTAGAESRPREGEPR